MQKSYNIPTFLLWIALASITVSCEQENSPLLTGKGSLSLLMDTKSETDIPVVMKSAPTVDVDTFHIVIKKDGQPIEQNFDTFKELREEGQPLLLPVGSYTAEASSGELPEAAFGQPCYRGHREFFIEENTVNEVKLHCTPQSIKVSLKYTDSFLNLINPDFEVTVTNSRAELVFRKTETRSAYFQVSQHFTVHVKGTSKEFGTRIDFAGDLKHIKDGVEQPLKEADHLIVTLDAYKESPKIKSVEIQ